MKYCIPIGSLNSHPKRRLQNPLARSTSLAGNSTWTSFPDIAPILPVTKVTPEASYCTPGGVFRIVERRGTVDAPMRRLALLVVAAVLAVTPSAHGIIGGHTVDIRDAP